MLIDECSIIVAWPGEVLTAAGCFWWYVLVDFVVICRNLYVTRYKKIGLCAQNTFLDYSTYLPFYTSYTSSVKLIALVLYSCATSSFDEDVIPLPRYC